MGKMDGVSNVFIGVTSAVTLAFTTGCGDPSADKSEAISTIETAFSQSGCATTLAHQTFTGGIDPSIVTPRSYGLTLPVACFKGYVVDIYDLDALYTGTGNALDGRIEVSYADTAITDPARCEATELRLFVYRCEEASPTTGPLPSCTVLDDQPSYGTWLPHAGGGGECALTRNFSGVSPGVSYRVAARARNPSGLTQKIRIGTYGPVNID